jgi:tight adherence protein C
MSTHAINVESLIPLLAGVCAAAVVLLALWPLLIPDKALQRAERIIKERSPALRRERVTVSASEERVSLGVEAKPLAQLIYERFNLVSQADDSAIVQKLQMAGYRGKARLVTFLAARVVGPLGGAAAAASYLSLLSAAHLSVAVTWAAVVVGAIAGYYAPGIYVHNRIAKRQLAIRRAWPEVLDLLLICVQSGMSLDSAIKRVADEVSTQSIEAAEELSVLCAELSYLPDRGQAFDNLARRTGLDCVKAVVTSLAQAEKYGTAVTQALRVLAQESRDQRMSEAEKKAAALPPKLTAPMIVFFLPVLFAVILTPAVIQVMRL